MGARKGHLQINLVPTDKYLENALQYLGEFVETKNGHIVHPKGGADLARSIMMLSYYRNALVHFFMNESEIMTAIVALQRNSGGASKEEVFKKSHFLKELLSSEFVLRDTMRTREDFEQILSFMEKR